MPSPQLPPVRQQSLGRVLFHTWRDKAQAVYHCITNHFVDDALEADELQRYKSKSSALLVEHVRRKFDGTMGTLQEAGIAYDPRVEGALVPYGGEARPTRKAQKAWQSLKQTVAEDADYVRVEEIAAERRRRRAADGLRLTQEAWRLHETFILGAHRYALRWRVVGKAVVFKVRWVRKVLKPLRGSQ
ncbi:hypothetical protein PsYK624_126300 [Phanerochaete sordida]|uniref:Uncharacterized protein n=1 Tax=Phanerochaete sordida TaxID=48140 RepID=A0A9P3LIQ9_9APHY|nr:hypothetical protein PsYK624_126300 [Phanerochaete sordida]